MVQCPDCDNIVVLSFPTVGDGKCSVCHGEGHPSGTFVSDFNEELLGADPEDCDNCGGSGECPTCDGTGEVDGDDDDDY